MTEVYLWFKAFHLIAMIAWMAGLFYLPRLFVYHTTVSVGGEQDVLFQKMEHKLLKVIMNPAMIVMWICGVAMIIAVPQVLQSGIWLHIKLFLVVILSGFHVFLSCSCKTFALGKNIRSEKFYRIANEVPTLCMISIVILAVFRI